MGHNTSTSTTDGIDNMPLATPKIDAALLAHKRRPSTPTDLSTTGKDIAHSVVENEALLMYRE